MHPASFLTEAGLREVFEHPIHHTVGPAYQGYAEKEDFLPQISKLVRKLHGEEQEVLQALKGACEAIAWEHSGIDETDSALFGYFAGEELAAVAHYSMWADDAASIGVLTHPAYRGRGYGKAVVSAAMADAFEHGHLVIYQTLSANHPSVRLATVLGCRDYARTMAVHFVEDIRSSG
jgi:RimJ/RimL family protein N-acetyltransferase